MTENIRNYFWDLAVKHRLVRHEHNGECHFSSLTEEAQNFYARKMRYPCVALNTGDIQFHNDASYNTTEREITILFLDHCRDTGDYNRIRQIFDTTEQIMRDFIKRMNRDKAKGIEPMRRFSQEQAEAHQIYLESAGLYGWALIFLLTQPFSTIDCDHAFADNI